MPEQKKCIELIRVSTAGQATDDRASIPAQREVNRRTAAHHGLVIVKTIQITDVSGANVLRSPEMRELLGLIESPEIVGVVMREFSRLMRPDNYEDLSLLQRFVDSRTDIYLPDGRVDPRDLLMTMLRAGIAGKERKEMLERAWSAKEEKRRRGELAQSKIVLPYGVEYEKGQWRYQPDKAARVRQAFRQVLTGHVNYNKIAETLGVSHRGAALILRNPIWYGWRILDKKRDPSGAGRYAGKDGRQADRRKIARAPEDVIRVKVIERPLLEEKDWARAQEIMTRKATLHWRERRRQGKNPSRFTYAGFLRCAECGEPLHSVLARRDYYVCKGRRLRHTCSAPYMDREQLEAELDKVLGRKLTDPKFVARCLAQLRKEAKARTRHEDRQLLVATAARLSAKRTRILDTYLEGVLTAAERDARLATVDKDLAAAQARLAEIDAAAAPPAMTPELLLKTLSPLAEWGFWSFAQKRRALGVLCPTILIGNGKPKLIGLAALGSATDTLVDTDSLPRPA
jgi:DNA invertase Pin-like site-specific DNA recombinase